MKRIVLLTGTCLLLLSQTKDLGNLSNVISTATSCGGDLNGTMPNCGVAKANGGSFPASATVLATNGSGQPLAAALASNNTYVGNSSNLPVAALLLSIGGLQLAGALIKTTGTAGHIASGDVDLYTPASGKKAIWFMTSAYNDSASNVDVKPEIKIGGVYYQISPTRTQSAHASDAVPANIVLDATMTAAVNVQTGSVLNIWPLFVEFNATVPIKTAIVTSLSSGDNTLYTAAGNPSCLLRLNQPASGVQYFSLNTLGYWNNSGAGRTITFNVVASGGVPASTNAITTATTVSNGSTFEDSFDYGPGCMATNSFISIKTDAATATQIAWVNVIEY